MLTCEDCGTALNEDVAKISNVKVRALVCRSCRMVRVGGASFPLTNPCAEVKAPVGRPQSFRPSGAPIGLAPPIPKIERDVNLPIMMTVLQAALDWPADEVEALAAHLFEIATATTAPSLKRDYQRFKDAYGGVGVFGDLTMVDYLKLIQGIGDAVVPSSRHAVVTDVF